jgi:hypothetical protein
MITIIIIMITSVAKTEILKIFSIYFHDYKDISMIIADYFMIITNIFMVTTESFMIIADISMIKTNISMI